MERDSFIFYRSFYEAIKCMPQEVQIEIYPAIMEYALFGKQPKNLSEIAKGMFALIKPNIDVNTSRFLNGKKGGRKRSKSLLPDSSKDSDSTPYSSTFNEEVEKMKQEGIWLDGVGKNFDVNKEELANRLDRFVLHCNTECSDKPHSSLADAKRHFTSWMRKAYPEKHTDKSQESYPETPDYTFKGGFGGLDV